MYHLYWTSLHVNLILAKIEPPKMNNLHGNLKLFLNKALGSCYEKLPKQLDF